MHGRGCVWVHVKVWDNGRSEAITVWENGGIWKDERSEAARVPQKDVR